MKRPKPIKPRKDQESVWDYPRPPKAETFPGETEVWFDGHCIARSSRSKRILETSHPPVFYLPIEDVDQNFLRPSTKRSFCEWKGMAKYFDVVSEAKAAAEAAWYYPDPKSRFRILIDHVAFYPSKMEACFVNGERVTAQEGDFYGGWITSNIVGPFKGTPGSFGW